MWSCGDGACRQRDVEGACTVTLGRKLRPSSCEALRVKLRNQNLILQDLWILSRAMSSLCSQFRAIWRVVGEKGDYRHEYLVRRW